MYKVCDSFFEDFFENCIVVGEVYYLPFADFADFQIRCFVFCAILLFFGFFLANIIGSLFAVFRDLIRRRLGG